MTILDSIRNYVLTCPYLKLFQDAFAVVNVDYTNSSEVTTYSIEEGITSKPIQKKYVDGSTVREYLFVFSSIEFYGDAVQQNIDNCGFYEDFQKWLEDNTSNGILPTMGNGKEARKIEALTNGYMFNNAANGATARYQIQCKLTYFQNK